MKVGKESLVFTAQVGDTSVPASGVQKQALADRYQDPVTAMEKALKVDHLASKDFRAPSEERKTRQNNSMHDEEMETRRKLDVWKKMKTAEKTEQELLGNSS